MTSIGERLAEYCVGLRWDDLPTEVRDRARDRLLDVISTAVGGRAEPVTQVALASVDVPLSTADRAFLYGVSAHALLWDDSNPSLADHPGVVIGATLLALGETRPVSIGELLTALVCGYEVQFALGQISARPMIERGLRTTSTLGVVGAAAAAAHLSGLSATATRAALDIAANTAAGLLQGFEQTTMEPFLQAGLAARSGVQAARLGAAGALTSQYTFEGPTGYLRALSALGPELDIGTSWNILKIASKPYPISGAKIQATAAALAARATGFGAAEVRSVRVEAPSSSLAYPGSDHAGPFDRPSQAQNSFQFCVAAALAGRSLTALETFGEPDQDLTDMIARVRLSPSPSGRTELWVELTDGHTVHSEPPAAITLRTPSVAAMAEKLEGFLPHRAQRIEQLVTGDPAAPAAELAILHGLFPDDGSRR